MLIKVLDKLAIGEDTPLERLSKYGELVIYNTTTQDELRERISDADVIVLNKVRITKEAIIDSKSLRLICVFATGYDNIDINAAKAAGIAVCNVPAYSTDSVCLYTFATALALVAKLKEYNEYVRCGDYSRSNSANRLTPVFHDLKNKKWGIIGCGNIGSAVARVAKAFGAEVLVYTRTPKSDFNCVDLKALCSESDIISIHSPLTDETRGLISAKEIELMKHSVIIINEARGAVVNENDIANALKDGRIAGFGCDVYSNEPFREDHPYYNIKNMDNVILTPHTAWSSYESRCRCVDIIMENIDSYLAGNTDNRVDLR